MILVYFRWIHFQSNIPKRGQNKHNQFLDQLSHHCDCGQIFDYFSDNSNLETIFNPKGHLSLTFHENVRNVKHGRFRKTYEVHFHDTYAMKLNPIKHFYCYDRQNQLSSCLSKPFLSVLLGSHIRTTRYYSVILDKSFHKIPWWSNKACPCPGKLIFSSVQYNGYWQWRNIIN